MKRFFVLLMVVSLCLTSACSLSNSKKATPLSAVYTRVTKTGTRTATLTLLLSQGNFQLTDTRQGVLWAGSYKAEGDLITFTASESGQVGKTICPAPDPYSYHWSLDDSTHQMTFTKGEDLCAFRAQEMTENAWTQQVIDSTPEK